MDRYEKLKLLFNLLNELCDYDVNKYAEYGVFKVDVAGLYKEMMVRKKLINNSK